MSGPEKSIFGPEVDEEINQTWRQVEDRVIQMAGGDRSKINPNLNIDLVLSYLDKAQTTDKKAAEKYGTIRTVFNNTLQCIQTVGGIVADGASYAFAPAGTCYNALTFVITAWQGYEGIFESLASLLEKCTEFLDRLRYYSQSGMDSKLTKVACQHLQIFVDICDRSLKLKSKRHKFAAFMKQMFLNDDGVQDLLSSMNKLIDKERGLVAAQTWKSSNEAASYSRDGLNLTRKMHSTIVEDKNLQKREKEAQKWKHTIVDALELDHKILQEDNVEWEKAWKRHRSKILEGSGEWLIKDSRFSQWIEGTASPFRMLGLEGGDGAGKTLLASNVILHLRKMKAIGSSRVIVAHNFLELDTKSSAPTDTAMVISKNLMCQLAFGYDPVLKNFAAICERSVTFTSPLDMVTKLLLQNEDLVNLDVTFFLVLDGLGANVDTFADILKKFSTNALVQKTRILLTGTQELFNTVEKTGGVSVDKIILGEPNKQDVELYINHRMENMEMLKDASRPGVSDMREKILENLLTSTNGDFYKINRVLDNIANTDDVDEIISLLETAGEARPDQIEADIENLNQTRTAKEISEINEIILWIWAGWRWISPVEMEGIMALMPGNGGTSLMSMETKIKTKYTIFCTDYDDIDFKLGEMLDKIPLKKRDPFDENSSSGFKEIQPAEINIVRYYLSTVCPPDLYKKFGFDEFFELKMGRKANYIYRDPDNGHVTMVIRCLTCLVETRNEKTELVLNYASTCLRWHMEMTDLSLADRELKSQAGELLVRLFTEKYALDSLFSFHTNKTPTDSFNYETPVTWESWIRIVKDDASEGVELISKWFNDSAVIEKVKSHPLVVAFKADEANKHLVLYEKASKGAAEDLFVNEATIDEKFFAFSLLYSLLARKDESVVWNADYVLAPTLDIVQSVENLAETILEITDKNAAWEAQAASLFAGLPGDKIPTTVAIERATKALELDPTNWSASWTLLKSSKSDEAAAALEKVVDQLMENTEWRNSNERHRAFLAMMLFDLGKKYWESEDTREKAIQIYSKVLEIERSFSILKPYFNVLNSYSEVKMWTKIISFFEELLQVTTNDGQNLAAVFVGNGLANDEYSSSFISVLVNSIKSTDRYDLLKTIMEKTTEIELAKLERFLLGRNYADVLAALGGHEDEGIAVLESLMVEGSESNQIWMIRSIVDKFVVACKKLATLKDIKAEKAQEYDKKVQWGWDLCESKLNPLNDSIVQFALYWRDRGHGKLAKKLLITPAKESLEMLYDDDTENDMVSFWYFSLVFATLRDTEHNLVAWHMMEQSQSLVMAEYERKLANWKEQQEAAKTEAAKTDADGEDSEDGKDREDGEQTPESEAEPEPVKPDIAIATCDGCNRDFITPDGIWVCLSEGGMTHLCEDCYPKLKAGEVSACDKDHEHLHLVQDEKKMAEVPKGSVLFGERIITLEEWKLEVKAKYVEYDDSK